MKVDSCAPERISRLPAEVTLEINDVDKPLVSFARKGKDCPVKLKVLRSTSKHVKVLLPEKLASQGPGIYTIRVMEGCELCDETDIEFTSECKITSVEVKEHEDYETCSK